MFHFSKSKYTSFIQCPKMLWLKTYHPELAEEDPSAQERMTKGNVVGDLAMGLFGEYEEMTAYNQDGKIDLSKMIENTYKLTASIAVAGAIVCLFPYRRFKKAETIKRGITKRTLLALLFVIIAIPLTMYIGIHHLEDRKYYFISILMIIQ